MSGIYFNALIFIQKSEKTYVGTVFVFFALLRVTQRERSFCSYFFSAYLLPQSVGTLTVSAPVGIRGGGS